MAHGKPLGIDNSSTDGGRSSSSSTNTNTTIVCFNTDPASLSPLSTQDKCKDKGHQDQVWGPLSSAPKLDHQEVLEPANSVSGAFHSKHHRLHGSRPLPSLYYRPLLFTSAGKRAQTWGTTSGAETRWKTCFWLCCFSCTPWFLACVSLSGSSWVWLGHWMELRRWKEFMTIAPCTFFTKLPDAAYLLFLLHIPWFCWDTQSLPRTQKLGTDYTSPRFHHLKYAYWYSFAGLISSHLVTETIYWLF